jgi:uncharacterized coiled-coil DUF342 family protein
MISDGVIQPDPDPDPNPEINIEAMNEELRGARCELGRVEEAMLARVDEYEAKLKLRDEEIAECRRKCAEMGEIAEKLSEKLSDKEKLRDDETEREVANLRREIEELEKKCGCSESNLERAVEKIELLRGQKRDRKGKIRYLEEIQRKAVQALKSKSEALRSEFERTIEEDRMQMEALRADLAKAEGRNRELAQENDKISDDLRNAIIGQKSVALKMKTIEEKYDREKRTILAQTSAKVEQLQENSRRLLEDVSASHNALVQRFIEFANRECHGEFPQLGFDEFFAFLRKYFEDNRERETVYEETVADVMRSRQILGISPSEEIHKKVASLLSERNEIISKIESLHRECGDYRARNSELCASLNRFEGDLASLRQWETWAKRLYRLVFDSAALVNGGDQLRLSLEECLLANVCKRSLVGKLVSLREQKKALISCEPGLLKRRGDVRPTMFAAITVVVAGLRLQRMAGIVNISVREGKRSTKGLVIGGDVPRHRDRAPLFNRY